MCGFVNGDAALVGQRIFQEDKRAVDRPVHHADSGSAGAAVVETVVLAAFEIDKGTGDDAVGTVIPGGRIRRGAAEHPQRCALGKSRAKVAAVDGVEAGRPREIETAKSRDQSRVWIVVRHVQMVSTVDQALQRLLAGY